MAMEINGMTCSLFFLKERRMVEYVGIVNELGYTSGFLGGFFLNMLLRA